MFFDQKIGKILLSVLLAVMVITLVSCEKIMKPIDAFEQNKRLGRGVNIIGYDSIWEDFEQGRFKEKHFSIIKEGGFSTVRINLFPFAYMDSTNQYKLDESWLQTLDWAVNNAVENDLMAIIDFHEFIVLAKNPEEHKDAFLAFWRQISSRYKDLPSSVLFEILNEPNSDLTPELWTEYMMQAYDIIRDSNPNRTLVIGPPFWNSIEHLEDLILPEEDRNIIVTVHYYHPMEFTHQGAPWADNYVGLSGITWRGTEEQKNAVMEDFAVAQEWALKHNRPLLLGEFGAYEKADLESRKIYTNFIARTAEELGWSWTYWQFDSDFIVYDIDKDQWYQPIYDALIPKK